MISIEEKAFEKKRIIKSKLPKAGFRKEGQDYLFESEIMNGDFRVSIVINKDMKILGFVKDTMNDEEYLPIRMKNQNGAYVNEVRSAYEEFLGELASKICEDVLFASEQANRICTLIEKNYGIRPDFPWAKDQHKSNGVFRHADSGKWFGLIMPIKKDCILKNGDEDKFDILNLKTDIEASTGNKGIYPAYHMNHRSWISVPLNEVLNDDEIMNLINKSYFLTKE